MTFEEAIQTFPGRLTKTDRRIIDELLANPREGALLSLPEIAHRAAAHPTSAVRLAQKLGYSGYPDLRSQLQSEMLDVLPPAERVRARLAHMEGPSILSALVESEIAALQDLPRKISQDEIETAARAIIRARRIYVFGRNHAATLKQLLTLRLQRSGYLATAIDKHGKELADELIDMRETDLVIGFAFTKLPEGLEDVLRYTQNTGALSMIISDYTGATLRPNPDILLAASRGERGESQSLTVPLAVCNTLILEISRLDDGKSLASLEKLNELEETFAK